MGQKVGAVIIADDASLARAGAWTGFEWTLSELRRSDAVDEILVVSESETVRRLAQAWEVRCVGLSEVEGPTWVQATERVDPGTVSERSAPTDESVRGVPAQGAQPLSHAELARFDARLGVNVRAGGLLASLGLDIVLFVDASCPLWEQRDVATVVQACARANRAALACRAARVWTSQPNSAGLTELIGPACVELSVLRALRLTPQPDLPEVEPIFAEAWKGWSLRDPIERLAVVSVWTERHKRDRLDRLPIEVGALVMDFDGVLTDNRVLVQQDGTEAVWCHRGDGLGIELLRKSGLPMLVISKEKNAVVQARCSKLGISCLSGVDEKLSALQEWCELQQVSRHQVVFMGNDINDLQCLTWSGCGVAVHDSHPDVLRVATLTLEQCGGRGAVRELAEMILLRNGVRLPVRYESEVVES